VHQLDLVGSQRGLKTVPLITAVRAHTQLRSMREAKLAIDGLVSGRRVTLIFYDAASRDQFRRIAEDLGAICE
jgi:hypothetical protein